MVGKCAKYTANVAVSQKVLRYNITTNFLTKLYFFTLKIKYLMVFSNSNYLSNYNPKDFKNVADGRAGSCRTKSRGVLKKNRARSARFFLIH